MSHYQINDCHTDCICSYLYGLTFPWFVVQSDKLNISNLDQPHPIVVRVIISTGNWSSMGSWLTFYIYAKN